MSVATKFALLGSGGGEAGDGWSWIFGTGGSSGQTTYVTSVGVDSYDNVYFCGYTQAGEFGGYDILVGKFNSSGEKQWIKSLGDTTTDYDPVMYVHTNGDVYINYQSSANSNAPRTVKFDTDGTQIWQFYRDPTYWAGGYDIHMDGSIVFIATEDTSYTPDVGGYFRVDASNKANPSGKLISSGGTSFTSFDTSIVGMGSSSICVTVGQHNTSTVTNSHITKWDTSTATVKANLNWGGSSASNTLAKIVYDNNGGHYFYTVGVGRGQDPVFILFSTPSATSTTISQEDGLRYSTTDFAQLYGCCFGNNIIGMHGLVGSDKVRWNTLTRSGATLSDRGYPMQIQTSSGTLVTAKNNMAIDSGGNIILGFSSNSQVSSNRGVLVKLPANNSYTGSIQSAFNVTLLSSFSPSTTNLSISTDNSAVRNSNSNTITTGTQSSTDASISTSYESGY